MAFMTLKTIVFQTKKKNFFNFAILFLLLSLCYLVSLITGQIFVARKFSKEIGVTQSYVFKEFIDFTGFDTENKLNSFLTFVMSVVLFVDVRHILDNCKLQSLLLEEYTNPFNYFIQ